MANSMEGQETVHSVVGPIAHSADGKFWIRRLVATIAEMCSRPDLKLFVTSVLKQEPWAYDSKVIPMPWRQAEEDAVTSKLKSGGLTLGFFNCDGNVNGAPFSIYFVRVVDVVHRSCLILPSYVGWTWLSRL